MSIDVSLVVTDLDGTLWHTDDDVAPSVVAAVRALEARGVPVLVATGRRLASTRAPLARVGLEPPAVVLNGALGIDLATGTRFHRAPYPTDEAVAVLAGFRSAGLDPVVYLDHPTLDAVLSATPSTHPEHVRQLGAPAADLDAVVAEEAVLGFSVIGVEHGRCVAARDAIGDRAETHLDRSIEFAGYATLTVAPLGQSKWDGVLAYCAAEALDPARVLAVGDGSNDVELLTGAAVALVPAVAHPDALAAADHVIPAAADAGWTSVLDHV
ncbi:MAG TPA: HAD family hydrolase [Iamia sp.]|nr:HAD family hydrolase [Iamia sp.]